MLFWLAVLFTLPGIIASRVLVNESDRPIARTIMNGIQRLAVSYVALAGYYADGMTGAGMCLLGSATVYLVTSRRVRSGIREIILPTNEASDIVAPEDHPSWSTYRP